MKTWKPKEKYWNTAGYLQPDFNINENVWSVSLLVYLINHTNYVSIKQIDSANNQIAANTSRKKVKTLFNFFWNKII